MKIFRNLEKIHYNNGEVEIELTSEELRNAYEEMQHRYDIEDIECVLERIESSTILEWAADVTGTEVDKAAYKLRENITEIGGCRDTELWDYLAKNAIIETVLEGRDKNGEH